MFAIHVKVFPSYGNITERANSKCMHWLQCTKKELWKSRFLQFSAIRLKLVVLIVVLLRKRKATMAIKVEYYIFGSITMEPQKMSNSSIIFKMIISLIC